MIHFRFKKNGSVRIWSQICVFITCEKINDLREKKMFEKKSLHTNSKKIMFETKKKVLRENIFSQNVKKYKFNYF